MNLLDEIEAIKNVVTGGAAEVSIEAGETPFGDPIQITVRVKTGDEAVKVDRVYVQVRGCEETSVPSTIEVHEGTCDEVLKKHENTIVSYHSAEIETTVAEAQELAANTSFKWQVEIVLPADAQPPCTEEYRQRIYQAFAGLDCFGNDPDSGWVDLSINVFKNNIFPKPDNRKNDCLD